MKLHRIIEALRLGACTLVVGFMASTAMADHNPDASLFVYVNPTPLEWPTFAGDMVGSGHVYIDYQGATLNAILLSTANGYNGNLFDGDPTWITPPFIPSNTATAIDAVWFGALGGSTGENDDLGAILHADVMDANGGIDWNTAMYVSVLTGHFGPDSAPTVTIVILPIPEPSTWLLLGLGSLGFMAVVRRRCA